MGSKHRQFMWCGLLIKKNQTKQQKNRRIQCENMPEFNVENGPKGL